jgi:hypothetical protein
MAYIHASALANVRGQVMGAVDKAVVFTLTMLSITMLLLCALMAVDMYKKLDSGSECVYIDKVK